MCQTNQQELKTKMNWINYTRLKPQQGQIVDIWVKGRGRENDYSYEGNGEFYHKGLDMFRDFGRSVMEVTHWMPVPLEPIL